MSYRIGWRRRAKEQLAAVWLNSSNRNKVTAAAHRIETLLRNGPLTAAESRAGDFRVIAEGPISVLYKIDPQRNRVIVISVGASGRSP
jgi:mRNA-degrading endonuclease RelE of RelBE toxin-antitoxin system